MADFGRERILAGRRALVFGASGRLGSTLACALGRRAHTASWADTTWQVADAAKVAVQRLADERGLDVIFATGLTDPRLSPRDLENANLTFPRRVIDATLDIPGLRWLTLGSALEQFDELVGENPYLASKEKLANYTMEKQREGLAGQLCHLQLHTAYGSRPASHLFTGQMLEALARNSIFKMSSGQQLREYHHVADLAASINALCAREWTYVEPVYLSSGKPIRLRDLADQVFACVRKSHLLQIGRLRMSPGENETFRFPASPDWLLGSTRDPIRGVAAWLQDQLRSLWG